MKRAVIGRVACPQSSADQRGCRAGTHFACQGLGWLGTPGFGTLLEWIKATLSYLTCSAALRTMQTVPHTPSDYRGEGETTGGERRGEDKVRGERDGGKTNGDVAELYGTQGSPNGTLSVLFGETFTSC